LTTCSSHPEHLSENGTCRSCSKSLVHFSPFQLEQGCCFVEHKPKEPNDHVNVLILHDLKDLVIAKGTKSPVYATFQLEKAFFSKHSTPKLQHQQQIYQKKQYLQRDKDMQQMSEWIKKIVT
jgi:hypothetical protein